MNNKKKIKNTKTDSSPQSNSKMNSSKPIDILSVRKRTRRSFVVFGVSLVLAVTGWTWTLNQVGEGDRIPKVFRQVLEWNGRLGSVLYSKTRVPSLPSAPPVGKNPRVNGDIGLLESVDEEHWKLKVRTPNLSGPPQEIELSLNEIKALPRTETTTVFKCIEGWSEVISYAGVRFSDFLEYYKIGMRNQGPDRYPYVGLKTPDGDYYVSIDMESMLHPQTLLAYEMNGMPLTEKHGAPLRLMIPVKYGIKSLKRIGTLFFSESRPPDYWEERGYDWFSGL